MKSPSSTAATGCSTLLGGVCLAKAGLDKTGEAQGRIKEGLWIDSNILN